MLLSTTLSYAENPAAMASRAVAFERAGLDIAWVPEAYGFDGPTLMGYLAARTERVRIGSGILPIYSRSPTLLAQTAAGLDALSDGRALLGLGASGPQVVEGWHGVPYDRPLARTREIVDICRRAWRRERIEHEGTVYRLPLPPTAGAGLGKPLKMLSYPVRERVPIYLAAMGEKNVELTAEIADGWMPAFFMPEKACDVWGSALAAGRARRTPGLGELDVVAGGFLAVGEARETAARDAARTQFARYIGGMGARNHNFYYTLVCGFGYESEASKIQDLYLAGRKREAEAAVPDELIDLTNLIGPEGYVRERLDAYRDAGVTILSVTPVGPEPERLVKRVKEWLN